MRDSGGCALASGGCRASISANWGVWAPAAKQESSSEEEDEEWNGGALPVQSANDPENLSGRVSDLGSAPCSNGGCPSSSAQRAPTVVPMPAAREVREAENSEEEEDDEERRESEAVVEEEDEEVDEDEDKEEDDRGRREVEGLEEEEDEDGDEHQDKDGQDKDDEHDEEEKEVHDDQAGTNTIIDTHMTGADEIERLHVGSLQIGRSCQPAGAQHLPSRTWPPEDAGAAATSTSLPNYGIAGAGVGFSVWTAATGEASSAEEEEEDGQGEHHKQDTFEKRADKEQNEESDNEVEQQCHQDEHENHDEGQKGQDKEDKDEDDEEDEEDDDEEDADRVRDASIGMVNDASCIVGLGATIGGAPQNGASLQQVDWNNWTRSIELERVHRTLAGTHGQPPEIMHAAKAAKWVYDDGGRADAGFLGKTGDCFTRAVAIASRRTYKEIYSFVNVVAKELKEHGDAGFSHKQKSCQKKKRWGSLGDARRGVKKPLFDEVMHRMGWVWTATMAWGTGCKTHLKAEDLPSGRLVCRVTKHMVAVIDGVIHDTYDASRDGTRCVYGYFSQGPNYDASAALPSFAAPAVTNQRVATPKAESARLPPRKMALPCQVVPIDDRPVEEPPQCRKRRTANYGRATLARQVWLGFSDDDSDEDVKYRCKRRKAQQQLLRG